MDYLVVGGKAVLGQQSIAAIRRGDPAAWIASTSSGTEAVPGAEQTITDIDLSAAEAIDRIVAALGRRRLRAIVYVPARGPVGKPVQYASAEEYQSSIHFSVIPMLRLMAALKPELGLWFSGFMWLESLQILYGPMIYTKITMEQITLRHPGRLKCVRYGMFTSFSSRGIAILSQKAIQSGKYPEQAPYYKAWKESGKKFGEYFASVNCAEEERVLAAEGPFERPYRPLQTEDLGRGVYAALFTETKPILNLVGDWYWESDSLPRWPPAVQAHLHLVQPDLDRLMED